MSRLIASLLVLVTLWVGPVQAQVCKNAIPDSTPTSRFMVSADGTATDTVTGLMWKRCAEGQTWNASTGACDGTVAAFNWQRALQRATQVNAATAGERLGYTDWRVPDQKELTSLVERRCYSPAINDAVFPGTPNADFWSASPYARNSYNAWSVYFGNGIARTYNSSNAILPAVRLVRFGQSFGVGPPSALSLNWPISTPSGLPTISQDHTCRGSGCARADRHHAGLDIAAVADTPVLAAAGGTVVSVQNACALGNTSCNNGYGNTVILQHAGGLYTEYAHLLTGSITVAAGATITQGQQIAQVGATGNVTGAHLHFEVKNHGGLRDSTGTYFAYLPGHPNSYGYFDPWAKMANTTLTSTPLRIQNPSGIYVRRGPGANYSAFTQASANQRFVAFARVTSGADTWYRVHVPCGNGTSCAGWIAGSYQGVTYSVQEASATQVEVVNTGTAGLNVRASVGGSIIDKVFDGQRFVSLTTQPAGSGCASAWHQIDLPASSGTQNGWVCGDYVQVSGAASQLSTIQGTVSAGSSPLSGVTMTLGGAATGSATTLASGSYAFAGLNAGSYTLTPSRTGYAFSPTSRSVSASGATYSGNDFRACQTNQTFTGVLRDQNGQPITSAQAAVSVGGIAGTLDANGNYTVTGLTCGTHTLTVTPIGAAGFQAMTQAVDTFNGWTVNLQLADASTALGADGQFGQVGDPVNTATGNYIYQHRDLEIAGIGLPFVFDRSYNSRDDHNGPLGYNWTHNWNASLAVDVGGAVTVRWGDGGTERWVPNGSGGFIPQAGVFDDLIDDGGGAYTVRKRDLSAYHFDAAQRLASVTDKNGNALSLSYTGDNLTQITDTAGRVFTLAYDAGNRITQITDPIARSLQFAYDANGDLVSATDANGNVTAYTYDANHQILTVVDPRGNTIVSNTYDAQARVVTYQTDAKGGAMTYVYDAIEFKTTFTDPMGLTTVHYHDPMLRLIREEDGNGGVSRYEYDAAGNRIRVIDKNGNETQYGYDARGNVTAKTDALGHVTSITYDAQNNPLSRTDALGNVTQFQYDAHGNLAQTTDALGHVARVSYTAEGLPETLTDALGQVTTHAYDAEGNRIQITDPLGQVTTHTYDGVGRRLSTTDPLGQTTSFSHDANNNLLTVTDPLGHTVSHTYDGNDNRISTTDRNGNLTRFSYDEKDLLTSTTDALGNITTTTYDALDRKIAVTDARGNVTQYAYDAVGNQTRVTDALGNVTQFTYDPNGNRLSATDANGHTTTFQYDALNRRTRVTDPQGHRTTTAYDALGQVVSVTSAAGQVTASSFDAVGRLVRVTDALGGVTEHAYDANGNRISTTDPRGNATTYIYDALDRKITVTDALGNTVTTAYDAAGQVASITDLRGNTTTSSYDAAGRLTQVSDALGNVTQHSYDANGNRLSTTDALGRVVGMEYDALDRVVSRTDAGGAIATLSYDDVGNLVSETDRNGNTTQYAYDAVNRRTRVTDALGHVTRFAYDAVGNRISVTNPLGQVSALGYDANNRPVTATDPLGSVTTTVYDPVGRVTSSTDALGQSTAFVYDALNRLTQVTDAQGGVVRYTYDANGNRLSMTDPNGNVTQYVYDVLNRQTTTTEALGHVTTVQYDPAGNVTRRTDARGLVTQYTYDDLNRLATAVYPSSGTVTFNYDAVGNRTRMTDGLGTATTVYDQRNRVTQITDPFGMVVRYGYDAQGNRTSLTYPGNRTVIYGYDAGNRLVSVTDWLSRTTNYQYDAGNRLSQTGYPNGTQASYGYDGASRLTSLVNNRSDASVISSYTYQLDAVGNQLAEDRVEPISTALLEDARTNAFDAENRLTATNAVANSFDANGNLTAKGGNAYAYDEENRLRQTDIAGATTEYAYDALGNRYSRTHQNVTTRFVLDTNTRLINVLAETDTQGNIQAYNIYGLGLIARVLPDNTTHYYHYDSRGSTVALSNASEVVTDSYAYDPFGKPVNTLGSTENPFCYLGRHGVLDEGGDLNYIRARYYDAEQQRFVSKDSYLGEDGQSQTLNRYAYGLNSPVRLIDVSGFSASEVVFGLSSQSGPTNTSQLIDELLYLPSTSHANSTSQSLPPNFVQQAHWNRNTRNIQLENEQQAIELGWIKLPPEKSVYHQLGPGNENNVKYVSPDGHHEAVFDSSGSPVEDPKNVATYNVCSPNGIEGICHAAWDVAPYYLWGNSPGDETTIFQRVTGRYAEGSSW